MFYDQYERLCREHNVKPTRVMRDLGQSSTSPQRWREGMMPKIETVLQIAEYFGVSLDYLFAEELGRTHEAAHATSNSAKYSSNVIQGGMSNNTNIDQSRKTGEDNAPQGLEAELLRAFARLTKVNQAQALSRLYELEAAQDAAEGVRKTETDGTTSY